jgi:transcriptional regulator with XRE-family HTH domain
MLTSLGSGPRLRLMETAEPFPLALRELVIENDYVTQTGKPNWAAFAAEFEDMQYESIRRVAAGRRYPSARLIEECARVLRVRPEYFVEYRIHLARREFDPRLVGFERARANVDLWFAAKESARGSA